jgi:hypothetical protein
LQQQYVFASCGCVLPSSHVILACSMHDIHKLVLLNSLKWQTSAMWLHSPSRVPPSLVRLVQPSCQGCQLTVKTSGLPSCHTCLQAAGRCRVRQFFGKWPSASMQAEQQPMSIC